MLVRNELMWDKVDARSCSGRIGEHEFRIGVY